MRAARREAPRRRALEELLRPRPHLVDVHPARRSRPSTGSTSTFAKNARRCATPTWRPSRPATPSARPPSCSTTPTQVKPAPQPSPASTPTSPATPRWPGAWSPPASWPSCRSSSARYPITPASDILHELSKHKNFGVRTLQAEDEIAGIGAALGAAFGGHLGVTTTSGPGVALKSETIGLAVSLELPLLIIDIQRGGPSTGLPTKTEQADLLHGHVRPPRRVAAADRRRLQPVALLRRRHRGGPHRAQVPHAGDPAVRRLPGQRLRAVAAARRRRRCPTSRSPSPPSPTTSTPTAARVLALPARPRDARPAVGVARHARPHAPHRRHREGGRLGQHQLRPREPRARWSHLRAAKVAGIANDIPDVEVAATSTTPRSWSLGWGSTWGAIGGAVDRVRGRGPARSPTSTSSTSTRSPRNLGDVLRRYPKVLVPEMNLGQLAKLLRAEFLVDAKSRDQGQGRAVHGRRARAAHRSSEDAVDD